MLPPFIKVRFAIVACTLTANLSCAFAQTDAQHIQKLIDQSRKAVVKLRVTGTEPKNNKKDVREGSGFFVYSRNGQSYIITAAHVIGSSETDQTKNEDWAVYNGVIDRKIELFTSDNHGNLIQRFTEVTPVQASQPGLDIAVLSILGDNYETLSPIQFMTEAAGVRKVLLLGYEAKSMSLGVPAMGTGLLNNVVYQTSGAWSQSGQSGGAWIDIESGKVLAVAREVRSQPGGVSNEATPIPLIVPLLSILFNIPQEARARQEEEKAYQDAREDELKLTAYVESCSICEFKAAALSEIESLREKKRKIERAEQQANIYRDARGDINKLRMYVLNCNPCEFKDTALAEIALLEGANQEAVTYQDARGDLEKLKRYVSSCTVCEFKPAALAEIDLIEDQKMYLEARGDREKLRFYISSCRVCKFKAAAMSEVNSLEEKDRLAARAAQEATVYRDARGDLKKLLAYASTCDACEFKSAALTEIAAVSQRDCDRSMAVQFDADHPKDMPVVVDTATLSESDIENALTACSIAREKNASRRFGTQAGRAFAARAARRALMPGGQAGAKSDMAQAVDLWKTALADGSGAAANFLGAYFKGSFNTDAITFVKPDYKVALEYWLKGSELGNIKAMRNAGGLVLLGSPEFAPVQRNVSQGRDLLERAIKAGDMTAASVLGQALFYGSPPEIGKEPRHGLELLVKACVAGDLEARRFFDREMGRAKYAELLPSARPRGCDTETGQQEGVVSEGLKLPNPGSTYWEFNQSIFSAVATGSDRKFYYYSPRETLKSAGVVRGTLFFEGKRQAKQYIGNAYLFSKSCGPVAYAVTGTISDDERQIRLTGKAPNRNDKCEIVKYVDETIILNYRPTAVN